MSATRYEKFSSKVGDVFEDELRGNECYKWHDAMNNDKRVSIMASI